MSKLLPTLSDTCPAAALLVAAILSACGPSQIPQGQPIISTQGDASDRPADRTDESEPTLLPTAPLAQDLKQQLIEDGQSAAKILVTTACEDTTERGVYATIYALRVGIAPDAPCIKAALLRGTAASSPLLRALSWRHLLTEKDIPLPEWTGGEDEDPTVQILAALAYLVRSRELPAALTSALTLRTETPPKSDRTNEIHNRTARTAAMAQPFDDGLLTGTVMLAESLYEQCTEMSGETAVWTSDRIRNSLLDALSIPPDRLPKVPEDQPAGRNHPTSLGRLMENQLASNPKMLANIALNAPSPLRIQALRAILIHSEPPSTQALGAAAAALLSDDADVQIEAARTFLLLVRRLSR